MFFDINYGEYAVLSIVAGDTSTMAYANDNRIDTGYVMFNQAGTGGALVYNFGSATQYYIKDIFILDHNLEKGEVQYTVSVAGAWITLATFDNQTTNAYYYSHPATIAVNRVLVYPYGTQDSEVARLAEFVITKEKFTLNYNPSTYSPMKIPVGYEKHLLQNGKMIWNKTGEYFQAQIGWNMLLGDANTLTNTDLQNVTELARNNTSFLFWPNANNDFVNMHTWRKEDMYKCKITDAVSYEFPSPAIANAIMADYTIQEAQ